MITPLTRETVTSLIRNLTLDLTPEGKLKTALAAALLTAWDERDAVNGILMRPMDQIKTLHRAETAEAEIARLRAQLDSTLKDRALIMAERDTAKELADAMEEEAHAHIKLWGDALRRAEAAEAKLADHAARIRAAIGGAA